MWGPARQTTVQSRAPGGRPGAARGAWGACRGVVWGCGLLPSLSLRGCGEEDAGELRPESLGMGAGALAAGFPGWDGRGALGCRGGGGSPRRPGAKPRPVFASPKFLGFYPRNLPAAGTVGRDG